MVINGLDKIDSKIIDLLSENARLSFSEIGSIVGLSRTAVKNRITELENRQIISGDSVVVNHLKSPGTIPFILNVETSLEEFDTVKEKLRSYPEILTVLQTTGTCRLLLICVANCTSDVMFFFNRIKKEVKGILSINCQSVLDVVKGRIIPEK